MTIQDNTARLLTAPAYNQRLPKPQNPCPRQLPHQVKLHRELRVPESGNQQEDQLAPSTVQQRRPGDNKLTIQYHWNSTKMLNSKYLLENIIRL